jgi:hypothetical protein
VDEGAPDLAAAVPDHPPLVDHCRRGRRHLGDEGGEKGLGDVKAEEERGGLGRGVLGAARGRRPGSSRSGDPLARPRGGVEAGARHGDGEDGGWRERGQVQDGKGRSLGGAGR